MRWSKTFGISVIPAERTQPLPLSSVCGLQRQPGLGVGVLPCWETSLTARSKLYYPLAQGDSFKSQLSRL